MKKITALIVPLLSLLVAVGVCSAAPPPFPFITNPALLLPTGCTNGQIATYTAATNRWACASASGTGDLLADGTVAMTALFKADLSLQVKNGTDSPGFVDFYEDGSNGSSYFRLYGPDALAGSIFMKLPETAGTTGGQLYFSAANTLAIAAAGAQYKVWTMGAAIPAWSDYTITPGTNTFAIANGTASLDIAAGATLNIDTSLQVATAPVVLHGKTGGSSTIAFPTALSFDGTLTDGKACTYTADGTIIHCNSTFLAADGDGSALTGLQFDQFITQTAWRGFYSNADGDVTELALGAAGTVYQSAGATSAPGFSTYALPTSDCAENQILKANSSGDFVCAADATGGGTTMVNDTVWAAKGDLAVASANDTGTILSIGTASTLLKVNTDTPGWTSTTITEAANSLALANGTANMTLGAASVIDVAAGKTADINYNFTVNTGNVTLTGPFSMAAPGAVNALLCSDGTNWVRCTDLSMGALTATSITVSKSSGVAGDMGLYEANSTDTHAAGFRGPASITGDGAYRIQFPNARAAAAGQVLAVTNAGESGTGTAADPYVQTGSWITPATADSSTTFTEKTFDVDGTNNVLKQWGYIVLTHPHLCAAGAPMQTTSTANTFGQCKFGNATDKATNYAEYYLVVPPDIDTAIDLTATFKIKLGGADTGDHEYEISFDSVADSAAYAGSLGDAISLAFTADASGADGDIETAGETTLTGWKAAMTAGQLFVVRLARDGDHANDGSTVDSYSGPLVIKYKKTQ